jgi:uncharacterized membrane protein
MLIAVILCVEALAALGGLVAAGLFAVSTFVLRDLRSQPTADRVRTMNAINLATAMVTKVLLSGTASLGLAAALIWSFDRSWDRLEEPGAVMAIAGAVAFGLGAVFVTIERSTPLNKLLRTATDASSEMIWRIYRRDWGLWNHVRTVACAVTSALFITATVLHILHVIDTERMRAVDHGDPICLPCPNIQAD